MSVIQCIEFRTDTTIGISQSFKYNIPFGASGSTTVNVEETIDIQHQVPIPVLKKQKMRKENLPVPYLSPFPHIQMLHLKQISTGEVVQSYHSACILTYDVYYIKGSKYYHFTGSSDSYSKYSNAENVYHRAVTFLIQVSMIQNKIQQRIVRTVIGLM
ncbi:MAG: hypothetical protein ACLUU0_01725 [Anaerostipes hadrus]